MIENYFKKNDKKKRKDHLGKHYQIIWFKKRCDRYFVNFKVNDIDLNNLFRHLKNRYRFQMKRSKQDALEPLENVKSQKNIGQMIINKHSTTYNFIGN